MKQLAFSVASIQLFVYLLAPLFNHINEEEIESHIRLESGLRLWQALWQVCSLINTNKKVKENRKQNKLKMDKGNWKNETFKRIKIEVK